MCLSYARLSAALQDSTKRPCTPSHEGPSRARAKFRLLLLDDSLASQLRGTKLSPLIADSSVGNSAKDVPDASYSQQRSSCSDPAPFQLVGSHQTPLISLCTDCVLCLILTAVLLDAHIYMVLGSSLDSKI